METSTKRNGVGSYAFARNIAAGRMDADRLLSWAIDHHLTAVQYCENLSLFALEDQELDRLADRATDARVALEMGLKGLEMTTHQRALNLAHRIGSPFVRMVIDNGPDQPSFFQAAERLAPIAELYRQQNIRLGIENHDRFPAKVLRQLVEDLGTDVVGICLDTANSLGCLEGTEEVVRELGALAINVHVKDIAIRRIPDMMGFTVSGTPLGKGMIDFAPIIAQTPNVESLTLELWPPAGPGDCDLEMEWAELSAPVLRTLS
jgi:3-oxoisoapionate decarboxylase